jgi:hypothetical protein
MDSKEIVALRLDRDLHRALTAGAKDNDRSVSSYVRCAVREQLWRDGQLDRRMPHQDRE